ncbi:MAG: pilus assembly protein PilM [Candidatus Brocadiaceae bacterium]|nr:pilus assembly protein PilM [Candidatus Brocadiaceae bacterium]
MLKKRVWGLDLGRSAVKGVLIDASDEGIQIIRADSVPLEGPPPDPAQDPTRDGRLWRALHEFRNRHPLHKAPVCVAIPAQNTFVRDLTLPSVGSRKIDEMVRYEAANEIPFVLDEVAWDYLLFDERPGEPTRHGLLLAVKRNVIETYVGLFSQLEIGHVDIITLAPLALVDFLRLECGDTGRTLVLDIGGENTNMLLMSDGRFWLRSMLTGGNRITAQLQEEFELSHEDAERAKRNIARSRIGPQIAGTMRPTLHELVRNVKANMTYIERMGGPTELDAALVVGGTSHLPGVRTVLGKALRHPVGGIDELKHIVVSPDADAQFIGAHLDELAVAIGAALCAADRDTVGVSFLPKKGVRVGRISRAKGLLLAAALVLWGVMLTFYVLSRMATAAIREPLDDYRMLATIATQNQQELARAMAREPEEKELRRLLSLSRGRTQSVQILMEIVDALAQAGRESQHTFLLSDYRCRDTAALKELEAARAGAAPAMRRDHSMLDVASEPEPEPTEDQGPPMLVGSLNGIIRMPRRGNPRDAYSTFVRVLLPRLQGLASLRKASARGTFVKGSKTVELDEGAWFATVAPGDLVRVLPAGQWQEVEEVASETRIVLAEPFPEEDGEGLCVFSAVAPTAFDDETLEFGVRFAVPKTPPAGLPVLSPGGSRP